ncbi:hypothetical protein JCM24511_01770 [Saitozyma sp. JCM 24511]|nr:hypothetical protein JCM24511_01770 [Saitozyma sp. JCM 24511]
MGVATPLLRPFRFQPLGRFIPGGFFFFFPTSIGSPLAFAAVWAAERNPSPPETRSRSSVRICLTFFFTFEVEAVASGDEVGVAERSRGIVEAQSLGEGLQEHEHPSMSTGVDGLNHASHGSLRAELKGALTG